MSLDTEPPFKSFPVLPGVSPPPGVSPISLGNDPIFLRAMQTPGIVGKQWFDHDRKPCSHTEGLKH